MKMKKILLPGMMAALAFAACTNEEIVSQQTEAPEIDLSNRPVVGLVDLNFDPQTRATLGDNGKDFQNLEWQNDAIGARLIDEPNGGNNAHTPFWNYSASQYAFTNYKYEKVEGGNIWATEALLVEGNYMFYAPYDENARGRERLVMNFPTEQVVNTEDAGIAATEANTSAIKQFYSNDYEDGKNYVFAVGHSFISKKSDLKVEPFMSHLYAYPEITLKNDYSIENKEGKPEGQPITIDKVIIKSNEFYGSFKINHGGLINASKDYVPAVKNNKNEILAAEVTAGTWVDKVNRLRTAISADIMEPVGSNKDITVDFDPDLNLEAGAEYSFHVVVPAAQYTKAEGLNVTVVMPEDENGIAKTFYNEDCVDKEGEIKYDDDDTAPESFVPAVFTDDDASKTLTYTSAKRYAVEEYNFPAEGDPYLKVSAGDLATYSLQGVIGDYIAPKVGIKTLKGEGDESFETFLKGLKNNTTGSPAGRTILEGKNFKLYVYTEADKKVNGGSLENNEYWKVGYAQLELTQELLTLVDEYLDGGAIGFTSKMIVSGEFKANNTQLKSVGGLMQSDDKNITLNNVTINGDAEFKGKAVVRATINGNVTFKGELADDWTSGQTIVSELDVSKSGTATFHKGGNVRGDIEGKAYFLNGTANVEATANSAEISGGTVNLTGDVNSVEVHSGATLNLNRINYQDQITVGKLVWNSSSKKNEWKNGTLNINADQDGANVVMQSGSVVIASGKNVTFNSSWNSSNNTTLTNNGTIKSALSIPAKGTYVHAANAVVEKDITNRGTIENKGDIVVETNNGTVKAIGSTTHTTVNSGVGTIGNDDLAFVDDASEKQTVYYTFKQTVDEDDINEFDAETYSINKVIFNEAVTLNKALSTDPKTMRGVKTLEFKKDLSLAANTMIGVNVETVEISNNVIFSGFDQTKSGIGFHNGTEIKVAEGKKLTVSYLTVATLNENEKIKITLAKNARLDVKNATVLVGKGVVPAYTSINNGKVQSGYYNETTKEPVVQDVVEIGTTLYVYSPVGLQNIANIVNSGNDLEGYTVKLANDIDLNNVAWTPIGNKAEPFNGVFDGNGKTISNLKVEGVSELGLFGNTHNFATIKNVTVVNATVKGNHNVGTILGQGYAEILNCTVKNASVESKAGNGEDGDKVGVIVGRLCEGASITVTGCSAENCSVSAGRDGGQLIGARYTSNKVENNTIKNVTVTDNMSYTGTESKNINAKESGRIING